MKLPKISILFLVWLAFVSCDTKSEFDGDFKNYFVKYYGEDGDQEAADMVVLDDGVLILGTSRVGTQSRIILLKVDGEGTLQWEKHLGEFNENAKDIEPTVDGNSYLILSNVFMGKDLATNEDLYDFKVIKIDAAGNKQDSVVYHKFPSQFMNSVTPLADGGFYAAGNTTYEQAISEPSLPPPDQEDILYVQFTPDFDSLRSNASTTGEHIGAAVKVFEGDEDDYIFIYSDSEYGMPISANSNHAIFEVFFQSVPWVPSYALTGTTSRDEILKHVIPDPFTNGYFEIGTSSELPTTTGELYFAQRDQDFSIIRQGSLSGLGGSYTAAAAAPCSRFGQGYLLLANESLIAGSNLKLIKVDQACDIQWSVNFGSATNQSSGAAVAELDDGRILVLGTIELETQKKIGLIKVNPEGKFSD